MKSPVEANRPYRCLPLAALCVAIVTSGCQATAPLLRSAEDLGERAISKMRSAGEKNLATGATVAQELPCSAPGAAPARLESSSVLPQRPRPGGEINHRLVISACPLGRHDPAGTLTRRFTHLGRTMFEDHQPYVIKPGRWAVDAFIGLPPHVSPGPYRLEVRFVRRGLQLEASSDFVVMP